MTESEIVALFVLVGVLFTAVIGVITTVLTGRQKATEALIADLRKELTDTRAEVKDNVDRIGKLERRERVLINYVHLLRKHISDGNPPPPPDWPAGLDV